MKLANNNKGNSLIEIIVSVGIFVVVMLIATGIFETVVKSQQLAVASQNTQENLRYAYEIMSKEMRSAQRSDDLCALTGSDTTNRVFNLSNDPGWEGANGNIFYFQDKNGSCVYYFLSGAALMVHRDNLSIAGDDYTAAATPDEIIVDNFDVFIYDNDVDELPEDKRQPYATLNVKAHAAGKSEIDSAMVLQTTVSSRMYE
jgi:type II secretory pathway component PulJ